MVDRTLKQWTRIGEIPPPVVGEISAKAIRKYGQGTVGVQKGNGTERKGNKRKVKG
jgi:hypothetical protein